MLHKIRAAMSNRDQLYQLTRLVQLDDAFFGGPDGLQYRGTSKTPVYIAVSTDNEGKPLHVKMKVAEIINKGTALEFYPDNIKRLYNCPRRIYGLPTIKIPGVYP